MSTPQNILSRYRSYSYHHILIACDNQAAAEEIRNSNSLSTFRDIGKTKSVGTSKTDATGKKIQTKLGSYVVILNGLVDTSFIVRDVTWFSMTAASTVRNDRFTSLAVEGSMTVEEPRGVNFLNALNGACDELRSDPSGVIWLLKTIFVGHRDTLGGDKESDYITDLLPLEFMMYQVVGSFSNTGGLYEITFAGLSNGAARFPQFSQVAQSVNVKVKPTLKDTLKQLEQKISGNSRNNRICVIEALKKSYPEFSAEGLEEFREVQYAIIAESPYDEPVYIVDRLSNKEKELAIPQFHQGVLTFSPKATVEGAIRTIMDRCGKVLTDRTQGDLLTNPIPSANSSQRYSWKIHSEISMVGKNTINPIDKKLTDKDIVAVIYRIRRYAELTNKTIEDVLRGTESNPENANQEVTLQTIKDNLITFDYFFTGKNIDIIEFDIKMDMGLAFLQTLASTNTLGSGTSQLGGTVTTGSNTTMVTPTEENRSSMDVSSDGEKKKKIFIRSRTPIFPATNINNVFQKNVQGSADSTLYHAMLTRHAALENVAAVLTIQGNPYLMSQTNRKPSDIQRKKHAGDDPEDFSRIMQHQEFMPAIVKVNIRMPEDSDTPSSTSTFDTRKFWYDGFYKMIAIDHKFSDGQFTQDLHILSLPQESFLFNRQETDISACGEQPKKKEEEEDGPTASEANTNIFRVSEEGF